MKVRIRENGPISEQPDKQAKELIEAGLWFPATREADEPKAEPKKEKPAK